MVSKFIAKYPVPEDFPDLLHDFAREVLRDQPENIYEYGAQYFKALYTVSIWKFWRINWGIELFASSIWEGNSTVFSYDFEHRFIQTKPRQ